MSTSFSITSSSTHDGRTMTLTCTQEKDISNNRSHIKWTLKTEGNTGSYEQYYSTGPTTVKINGVVVYHKERVAWSEKIFPTGRGSASGEIDVTHDDSGNKSISVSLETAIWYGTTKTNSGTWTLDTIPRASKPSCITWPNTTKKIGNVGDTIYIHMNRKSTDFRHKVYYYDKNNARLGEITGSGTYANDNIKWLIPIDFSQYFQNSLTGIGYIGVVTYKGNTQIGSEQKVEFEVGVPNYSISDPDSLNVSIDNTSMDISYRDYKMIVKGFSKLYWNIQDGSPQYYNSISKYYFTLIDKDDDHEIQRFVDTDAKSGTSDIFQIYGQFKLKLTLVDSRGITKDIIIKNPYTGNDDWILTIQDYSNPYIQGLNVYRSDENGVKKNNGTYLTISYSGLMCSPVHDDEHEFTNGVIASYRWRILGGEYSGSIALGTSPKITPDFLLNNTYEIRILVKDSITQDNKEIVYPYTIPLGKTDFNLTPYGAGFGTYHDSNSPNTIQSEWDIKIKGLLMSDFVIDEGDIELTQQITNKSGSSTQTVTMLWHYRKWKSKKLELWSSIESSGKVTSTWGTGLYTGLWQAFTNYPIPFTEKPVVMYSVDSDGSWNGFVGTCAEWGTSTKNRSQGIEFIRGSIADTDITITYNIYAVGIGDWE